MIGFINIREHRMAIAANMKKCKIFVFDSMPNYVEKTLVDEVLAILARCIHSLELAIGLHIIVPNFKFDPWTIVRSKETLQEGSH
ncbi:Ulp1-like peptidase [Cucumis melo var. makuwa]|uniref:Ulp1-like peptidase n=1 Tax=Cucumis melo var. makuwa TaxID=1194695 RepID=A0A5A7SUX7_CUCMM|nr:Ulp1-like peptidase [Cucumis melo var. makuwa]TYK21977.1 Ulp1-like peptidase [Cucumis melo var. makuwa]